MSVAAHLMLRKLKYVKQRIAKTDNLAANNNKAFSDAYFCDLNTKM